MRPRISIARLLAVVGACGFGFAALGSPSWLLANVVFTIALGAVVVAALRVLPATDRSRAYWRGFLVAGGAYLAVAFLPPLKEAVCPRLATEAVLDILYAQVAPPQPAPTLGVPMGMAMGFSGMMGGGSGMMAGGGGYAVPSPPAATRWQLWTEPDRSTGVGYQIGTVALVGSDSFRQAGHALCAMMLGVVGGLYGRLLATREAVGRPGTAGG